MTHDYSTKEVKSADLTSDHVLVGESGGLCAVYSATRLGPVQSIHGLIHVETEHGFLLLDPEEMVNVYDD